MAKTAAALHILVKEEKLALDLLEQIKNGADFGKLSRLRTVPISASWRRNTPFAHQANAAAI